MSDYGAQRFRDVADGQYKWRLELTRGRQFYTDEEYYAWTRTEEAAEVAAAVAARNAREAADREAAERKATARVASKRKHAQYEDANPVASRTTKRRKTEMAQPHRPGSAPNYHNVSNTTRQGYSQGPSVSNGQYQRHYRPTPTPQPNGYNVPENFDLGFQYMDPNSLPTPALMPSNMSFPVQGRVENHQGQYHDYSAYEKQNGLEPHWDDQQTFAPQTYSQIPVPQNNLQVHEDTNWGSADSQDGILLLPYDALGAIEQEFDTTGQAWRQETRRHDWEKTWRQEDPQQYHGNVQKQDRPSQDRQVPVQYMRETHPQDYASDQIPQYQRPENRARHEQPLQKRQDVQHQHQKHPQRVQAPINPGKQQRCEHHQAQTQPNFNVGHGSVRGAAELLLQQTWSPQPEYHGHTSRPVGANGAGQSTSGMPNSDHYIRNSTPVVHDPQPVRPVSEDMLQQKSRSEKRSEFVPQNPPINGMPAVPTRHGSQDPRAFTPVPGLQYPQRMSGKLLVAPGRVQAAQKQQFVPHPDPPSGSMPPSRKRKPNIEDDGFEEIAPPVKRAKKAHEGFKSTGPNPVTGHEAGPGPQHIPGTPHVTNVQPLHAGQWIKTPRPPVVPAPTSPPTPARIGSSDPSTVAPLSAIESHQVPVAKPATYALPSETASQPSPPSRKGKHSLENDASEEVEQPAKRMKTATAASVPITADVGQKDAVVNANDTAPALEKDQQLPEEDAPTSEGAQKYFSAEELAEIDTDLLLWASHTDDLQSRFKPHELKAILSVPQLMELGMYELLDDKDFTDKQNQELQRLLNDYLACDADGGANLGSEDLSNSGDGATKEGEAGKGDGDDEKETKEEGRDGSAGVIGAYDLPELENTEWTAYVDDVDPWSVPGCEGLHAVTSD